MRRAQRLFQIIQILRRSTRPVTAAMLATELEVSKRTVYRDIAELIGQRVPIEGEAGLGYVLASSFDMPPLMLAPDEIEALVLGAQWVIGRSDPVLARAAQDLIAKVVAVIPEQMRPYVLHPSVGPKPITPENGDIIDPAVIRKAIRDGLRLHLHYRDEAGNKTQRTVWPVILGYSDTIRILVAWCELRGDFRHFRTDRIRQIDLLDAFASTPGQLRRRWDAWRASIMAHRLNSTC